VPAKNVEVLRDRLRRVLVDPGLRLRLGQAGRRVYEQEFTLDHTVSKTIEVYREVLRREIDHRPAPSSAQPASMA
jgi:glycosyltransferase involved in cell wall biosynthesis